MKTYRADLHIHTVLSPCGDLDMSPRNIVRSAKLHNLDIIAITDHNSTLHGPIIRKLAEPLGITVLLGAEVTTREEAHCLCLFNTEEQRAEFQEFININLPDIANDSSKFGYQVVVNENDEILEEVEPLLLSALKSNVDEVERKTHNIGGLFIPAHVDRPMYSLISQLGFIPKDLKFDALEIFRTTSKEEFKAKHTYINQATLIKNSDSHYPDQLGTVFTEYLMEEPTFAELKKALQFKQERRVLS